MADQLVRSKSAELYERACELLPGGVSRNTVLREPHPIYVDHASGCRVTDIDGVTRVDFANNMASLIHGHAYPPVVEAVSEQLRRGSAFSLATAIEVRHAEHLLSRNPNFEKIRFTNSGTEAVMTSLKAARAFTGREKMAKVEGAYHGSYDYAEVSQTATPAQWGPAATPTSVPVARGTPRGALADVVVIPFNDPERALALLEPHRDELACVLLDPMPHRVGLSPADQEFVRVLRDWTERHGALLVFDEVITLRATYGGAQEWYDVVPDLTALGKIIGGGFPVGAVTGRADVMSVMDPRTKPLLLPSSGTFSGNPVSMTAGLVAMEHFGPDAVVRLNRLADRAVTGIREAIDATGARACVTGGGSMFRVHLKEQAPANYREAYLDEAEKRRLNVLLDHLFGAGVIMINTCSATISTAMGEAEIDALVDAVRTGLEEVGRLE